MATKEKSKATKGSPNVGADESQSVIGEPGLYPAVWVDGVGYAQVFNGCFVLTLLQNRWTPLMNGSGSSPDPAVCARLRFDINVAKNLHDTLGKMILSALPAEGQTN